MSDLVPSLRDSVLDPSVDFIEEICEIGIDSILDNTILREIPIVKAVAAICGVGANIHERNLLKQTIAFMHGFRTGTLDSEKIETYRRELKNNPKKQERELSRILVVLSHEIYEVKSKHLGIAFNAVVMDSINWKQFEELMEANSRMFSSDYTTLRNAAIDGGINLDGNENYQCERLISLGLMTRTFNTKKAVYDINGNALEGIPSIRSGGKDIVLTSFGRLFCRYVCQEAIE